MRYSLSRGMCAMGCTKRIIDEQISEIGKFPGKFRIILFFAGLEPHIFEQKNFTRLQARRCANSAPALRRRRQT